MEKPKTSSSQFPMAAPRSAVDDAMRWVRALGLEWHDVVENKVGLSRNTGFKLKAYTGGLHSLRKVEDWLVLAEQAARAKAAASIPKEGPVAEWTALGNELFQLDPKQFDEMLWLPLGEQLREIDEAKYIEVMSGLRDLIDAQRILRRFDWQLMFRGRPRKRYHA